MDEGVCHRRTARPAAKDDDTLAVLGVGGGGAFDRTTARRREHLGTHALERRLQRRARTHLALAQPVGNGLGRRARCQLGRECLLHTDEAAQLLGDGERLWRVVTGESVVEAEREDGDLRLLLSGRACEAGLGLVATRRIRRVARRVAAQRGRAQRLAHHLVEGQQPSLTSRTSCDELLSGLSCLSLGGARLARSRGILRRGGGLGGLIRLERDMLVDVLAADEALLLAANCLLRG